MSGPITNASATRGSPGKAATAIARAMGEFLASVVKLKDTKFSKLLLSHLLTTKASTKLPLKKINTGSNR